MCIPCTELEQSIDPGIQLSGFEMEMEYRSVSLHAVCGVTVLCAEAGRAGLPFTVTGCCSAALLLV